MPFEIYNSPFPRLPEPRYIYFLGWKNAGQSEVLRFMRIITILCLGIVAG